MGSHRNIFLALVIFFSTVFLNSCVSYQIAKYVEGDEVVVPKQELEVGETTLREVLSLLGAPDRIVELEGKNLLVYERALLYRNRLRVGIPLSNLVRGSFDISAYGTLVRYDSLALFFTPDGILIQKVFEKGSDHPYLKTLFSDK